LLVLWGGVRIMQDAQSGKTRPSSAGLGIRARYSGPCSAYLGS
jgi:hypothetical protein